MNSNILKNENILCNKELPYIIVGTKIEKRGRETYLLYIIDYKRNNIDIVNSNTNFDDKIISKL